VRRKGFAKGTRTGVTGPTKEPLAQEDLLDFLQVLLPLLLLHLFALSGLAQP
jgi:hypothetical protein